MPQNPTLPAPPQTHEEAQREFALTLSGFSAKDNPRYEDYSRCIHCGLCLNHCPTYRLWGEEADSPRGRIRQILLVDQGRLELGASFVKHIDRCLDCRACETACPSGVEYGRLVELARAQIEQKYQRGFFSRATRNFVFRRLLPNPRWIASVARLLRLYQNSGLAAIARASGILSLLGLRDRELLLPKIDKEFFFSDLGKIFPADGARRARVAFFAGCVAQVTFANLNRATIRVLQANGCDVVVPAGQVCCGALPAHAGVRDVARELARKNFEAFAANSVGEIDTILTNAAGCGSTLKEYPHLFPLEERDAEIAAKFSGKVRDVTEFLAELRLSAPMRAVPLRVTYQDSCHLAHGQKIREAPRQLIRAVPGVEFVEMPLSDLCCGSAGVYNVTQTKTSLQLLAQKMDSVTRTKTHAIVTANPGCILQLRAGAAIHRTGHEVLHVIELLDRALSQPR
ncbi:MAG TPA: heterodisulfide reductase-related iron-sulfur binding cluster [Candidatus Acidoferrales bacterium]|nr:heterodisulfide reductase-related iron-sulfur binding cluster [Candidatus Acidoferrales bacterium]